MRSIHVYLNLAKARLSLPSDYALSKELRIQRQSITEYRRDALLPRANVMLRLARLAGIPSQVALLEWQAWRLWREQQYTAYDEVVKMLEKVDKVNKSA